MEHEASKGSENFTEPILHSFKFVEFLFLSPKLTGSEKKRLINDNMFPVEFNLKFTCSLPINGT